MHSPPPRLGGHAAEVLVLLTPLRHVKAEPARAVHQRIRPVLERAVATDSRNDNRYDRVLPVLVQQNDIVTHRQMLPHKDVAVAIDVSAASRQAGVRDPYVDRGAVWTVSAVRMKAKREHRVPLCRRALEILDTARTLGGGSGLVFPMRRGRPLSMSTLPKTLELHRIAAVPHGFRSSFRDWAAEETDRPRKVIEAALAHVVQNNVEAAYARSGTCSSVGGGSWTIGPITFRQGAQQGAHRGAGSSRNPIWCSSTGSMPCLRRPLGTGTIGASR